MDGTRYVINPRKPVNRFMALSDAEFDALAPAGLVGEAKGEYYEEALDRYLRRAPRLPRKPDGTVSYARVAEAAGVDYQSIQKRKELHDAIDAAARAEGLKVWREVVDRQASPEGNSDAAKDREIKALRERINVLAGEMQAREETIRALRAHVEELVACIDEMDARLDTFEFIDAELLQSGTVLR